ncbi:hypothetical protein [Nostoc favosum]|nr:hypothetical protein [Nostoc favosum]
MPVEWREQEEQGAGSREQGAGEDDGDEGDKATNAQCPMTND